LIDCCRAGDRAVWSSSLNAAKSSIGLPRLAQSLHRELDVLGLDLAPGLDLGGVSIFRVTLKYSRANCRAKDKSRVNFSRMYGSRGMAHDFPDRARNQRTDSVLRNAPNWCNLNEMYHGVKISG
jgi:hypothetical protein